MVKRLLALLVLCLLIPFVAGCLPVLIVPVVAVTSVAVDRKVCQKKGIPPPAFNPALKQLVGANDGESKTDDAAPAKKGNGAKPSK